MFYLKKQDFYYGAMLSALISKKYRTVLIDGNDDRKIYQFTSDTEPDFIAYFKFCMAPTIRENSKSWTFVFSDDEIEYIKELICKDINIKLILLCGNKDFKNCEIAIVNKNEIEDSIFQKSEDKKRITLYREKNYARYLISRGGGRSNDLPIPTNRIEEVEKELVCI